MAVISLSPHYLLPFVLIMVPKTGSQSLREIFKKQGRSIEHLSSNKIHPNDRPAHITSVELKVIFVKNGWDWDNCFKFGFVRNPWDRELSAYFFGRQRGLDNSFSEFIENAPNQPLMHTYLTDVDYVARFENYEEEVNFIWKKLKLRGKPDMLHLNSTKHKPYWEYYTDKEVLMVQEKYKKDIELYNYEFGY